MTTAKQIIEALKAIQQPDKVEHLMHFFKTQEGEYGYGDQFLGIRVPEQRAIAKCFFSQIPLSEITLLLTNPYHEVRLTGLLLLTYQMKKARPEEQKQIVELYLSYADFINNWDLVDLSCRDIVGKYLYDNHLEPTLLYDLASTNHLWKQRISIVSTFAFIQKGELHHTFAISERLLHHKHDLIHKAVGWMLREAGKKDETALRNFLVNHYSQMPRTMLRYAIEKFPPEQRQQFLRGEC